MSTVLERSVTSTTHPADDSALLGTYRQSGPVFVGGRGCTLIAEDGREYLDFASGIAVNALGYGDAGVRAAFEDALESGLIHTSNLFRTSPVYQLAHELVKNSFADKVFFCNSGGESNEGAFKFARKYARSIGGAAKHEVVALRGSFHGRLFGSLAATDRPAFREPFEPLMPGVHFVTPGDVEALKAAVSRERTAAIIAEVIQAEGGVRPVSNEFLVVLREVADAADAVLIFDEVQTGIGRTGTFYAYEQTGVTPDILTSAKPLAGGLPMGAILLTAKIANSINPGDHATTFGGGPLVSTVALEVVRRIADPEFLETVRAKGAAFGNALSALRSDRIVNVRGRGLMQGIELNTAAAPFVAKALDAGLLILTAGENVIRLLPPLVISESEIERAVGVLGQVFA